MAPTLISCRMLLFVRVVVGARNTEKPCEQSAEYQLFPVRAQDRSQVVRSYNLETGLIYFYIYSGMKMLE